MRTRITSTLTGIIATCLIAPLHAEEVSANAENPQAVREVASGKRTVANAAWWGFDEDDTTEALQSAIDSGAEKVVVPNVGADWNVRPITLAGNQELVLEDGVAIVAKRGEYRGGGDSVLTARDIENLTIRGYGATVRMQKEDYIVGLVLKDLGWNRWFGQYEKAEWRMALSIRGCENVEVLGLTLRDSGGDGVYVDGGSGRQASTNIRLKDVVCDNNYRQGMSVISVDGLLVEDCKFNNTWGTPPSAGVDIEPDSADQVIRNVVFRNCSFADNYGDGIELFLTNLRAEQGDVSILFEGCRVTSHRGPGIRVTKIGDDGPGGLIEFRDCVVENTVGYGLKVQDKSADRARVRFVDCKLVNVANNKSFEAAWTPLWLHLFRPKLTTRFGGVDFVDFRIEDDRDRPAVVFEQTGDEGQLLDIDGTITVENPHGVETRLGPTAGELELEVKPAGK